MGHRGPHVFSVQPVKRTTDAENVKNVRAWLAEKDTYTKGKK